MTQEVINFMTTVLVAKFVLNDIPHAAGFTTSNIHIDTNEEVVGDKVQGVAIAWVHGKDVGSLHYDFRIDGQGELPFMQIDKEYRGLGIGGKMYRAVEGLAKQYRVKEITLDIGIPGYGSVEEAKEFWKSMGFTVEDSSAHKKLLAKPDYSRPPTPAQLRYIALLCQQLGKTTPYEEQVKTMGEAGRLIRELEAEREYRRKLKSGNPS